MEKPAPSFNYGLLTVIAVLVTVFYGVLVLFPSYLNHDVSWILYSSREMLNGGVFGTDIIDVNPPLAWWLSYPPVYVSELAGLSLANSFRLYVFLLIVITLVLLKQTNRQLKNWQIALTGTVLTIMPGYEFGQREHLMLILVTPYLASVTGSEKIALATRVVIGILAGIGICLKPYFLLIPLCVEIYRMARTGRISGILRIEVISMGLVGIAYVGAALYFAPAFFTDILPLAYTSYSAYGNPPLLVAKSLFTKSITALLGVAGFAIARVRWQQGAAFLVAAFGAALSVLVQNKGWAYQVLPVPMFLVLAVCLSGPPEKVGLGRSAGFVMLALAVFFLPATQAIVLSISNGDHSVVSALSKRFSLLPDNNKKVFAFITAPRFIWPAVLDANVGWTGRQCCVYLLPAAVNNPDNKVAQTYAKDQLQAIATTLEPEKPALIVFNRAANQTGFRKDSFDYVGYLKQQEAYVSLFSNYKETSPIGHYRIFERR